jgi:general stress protein 26
VRETDTDVIELQALLDRSHERSGAHLRSIITSGERTPSALQVVNELNGMHTIVVTTVSARGRPRTSAVDGHFLRGRLVFTTSGDSVKARDMVDRPAISAALVDGERFAIFVHGDAELLDEQHSDRAFIESHLTEHYGASPSTWGPEIIYVRVVPRYMIAYASNPATLGSL